MCAAKAAAAAAGSPGAGAYMGGAQFPGGFQCLAVQKLQGDPSGRGTLFVDINSTVPPHNELLILKRKSYFNFRKRLSWTRWTTMYKEKFYKKPSVGRSIFSGIGLFSCPLDGVCQLRSCFDSKFLLTFLLLAGTRQPRHENNDKCLLNPYCAACVDHKDDKQVIQY